MNLYMFMLYCWRKIAEKNQGWCINPGFCVNIVKITNDKFTRFNKAYIAHALKKWNVRSTEGRSLHDDKENDRPNHK